MPSLGAASRIGPAVGREGEEQDYVVAALLLREMMHVPEKIWRVRPEVDLPPERLQPLLRTQ